MTSTSTSSQLAPRPYARLSVIQQATLSLFWFANSVHWGAILIILLPQQALSIGGDAFKGRTLGLILALAAIISIVAAPVFGTLSDRWQTRWGRRHPWLLGGTILNIAGLFVLASIPPTPTAIVPYILAFMWIALFNNVATAPYSALIPDVVAPDQRGSASGWMALMTLLGNVVGVSAGFFLSAIGIPATYALIAGIMLIAAVATVLTIKERPVNLMAAPVPWQTFVQQLLVPFRSRDFTWVFWTRFLVLMGTLTVQQFVQYYMRDVVGAPYSFFGRPIGSDPVAATSLFLLLLLTGAMTSALLAGVLSDRIGRKRLIYVSGALQTLTIIVIMAFTSFEMAVITGFVFGLGYGAYQSVDWAIATDVLPSLDDYAKDMGVWHAAGTLPQVLATPLAGFLLDVFQRIGQSAGLPHLGYTVIFTMATLFFMLGTVLMYQVRGVR